MVDTIFFRAADGIPPELSPREVYVLQLDDMALVIRHAVRCACTPISRLHPGRKGHVLLPEVSGLWWSQRFSDIEWAEES